MSGSLLGDTGIRKGHSLSTGNSKSTGVEVSSSLVHCGSADRTCGEEGLVGIRLERLQGSVMGPWMQV